MKQLLEMAKQQAVESSGRTSIQFSHRFWRRGTWVRFFNDDGSIDMSNIGKNRAGEYCVQGKTWRNETIVGDENLPLISKNRVYIRS